MAAPDLPRLLTTPETPRAVDVMARAFLDDPLWRYLLPDAGQRARFMRRTYSLYLRYAIRSQRLYGVGEPADAVAVWTFPGQPSSQWLSLLSSALLPVIFNRALPSFFRVFPIFGKFDELQKHYAPEPHSYLSTIGVMPESQGRGLASPLIRPFLQQAEARKMGVYTETMTPSNVGLYEHYGFTTVEEYRVPDTDLCIWAFYRPSPR